MKALIAALALAGMITPASAQLSFQFGIQPDYGYTYQAPAYGYTYPAPVYGYGYQVPYGYDWQRPRWRQHQYNRGW